MSDMSETPRAPEIIVYDCGGIDCGMSECRICFPPGMSPLEMIEEMCRQVAVTIVMHRSGDWAAASYDNVNFQGTDDEYVDGRFPVAHGDTVADAVRALWEKWKKEGSV